MLSSYIFHLSYGVGCMITGGVIYSLLNKRKVRKRQEFTEFLCMTPEGSSCKSNSAKCKTTDCNDQCGYKAYRKVLTTLSSTRRTLDICVYLITCEEIFDVILQAFQNGVFVRILTDKDMSNDAHSSKLRRFQQHYVPVRVKITSNMMHNKFAVIDKAILITGSFNWTTQAFFGNYETGIITDNKDLVNYFDTYFQKIWDA